MRRLLIESFYWLTTWFTRGVLRTLARWRVDDRSGGLPSRGFVIVANHLSLIDPPLLSASFPRRIYFMAKRELFRSLMAPLVIGTAAIPVNRGSADIGAIRRAEALLRGGGVLGMFPEGTRSPSGQMQAGHSGTALLAVRAGVPVVPVAITGSNTWTGLLRLRRPTITVIIGRPVVLHRSARGARVEVAALSDDLMRRVAAMLPASHRGVYAEAVARQEVL